MNYKRVLFLAIFIILALQIFAVEPVLAADNFLEPILKPFKGVNVGETYNRYFYFVDAVLFFILFIGLAKFALKDKFAEAPMVPMVIGIMLAIGMAVFETKTNFNIGQLWWFVGLLFFVLLGAMIFYLVKSAGANGLLAFSLAYLVIYLIVQNTASELLDQINNLEVAGGIMGILFLLSIIGVVYGMVRLIKGIKTGEWELGSIGRKEGKEDRAVRREQKEEEKALKKEKKAGEKMLNLESEARNIDKKISDLEDLENRVMSMNLQKRKQQVDLLIELEQKLRDTWKIQKWLQEVYANISKPEYAKFESDIKNYTEKLNQLILSLQNIMVKLHDAIRTSKETHDTEMEKLFEDGKKEISELEKQFGQEVTNDQEFTDSMKKLEKLDVSVVGKTTENIDKINKSITDREGLLKKSKDSFGELSAIESEIKHLDQKNLDEIDRLISLCNKNSAEDIGKISRTVSATLNAPNISSDIDRAVTGQNETQKVAKGLIEMWRTGKRYLSGDSLTQLYQGIVRIHGNINRINELVKARTDHYNFASEFVKNYTSLEREDFNTVKKAAKEELETIKNHENTLIQDMKNMYQNDFLPIINEVTLKNKSANGELKKTTTIEQINGFIVKLDNFNKDRVSKIYNLDIRNSVSKKIELATAALKEYISKNDNNKGKIKLHFADIERVIKKIAEDLKKELLNEIKVYKEVEKAADESKAEFNTESPKETTVKEVKTDVPKTEPIPELKNIHI